VIARPIRITRTLVELSASIGFLKCGSITATCFLVKRNMIVTNGHVVTRIKEARRESNAYDHSEVLVHFDHEGNAETLSSGHKLKPFPYQENVISEELDYAFLYLENPTEGKVELGDYIRRKVPEKGSVCIVGHPNGEEKKEEVCPILPLHRDRRALELERRLREKNEHYRNSPSAAALHMYCPNVRKLYGDKARLTYDVGGMLEGSSGAPVFDMSCNIVAIHTHGFRLEESSIVEVGVTFQAIIKNLEETGYEEFVRENFPYHWVGDEDEKMEDEDVDTDETMDTD
jgi:V8-like Glu-specific endopeptidase